MEIGINKTMNKHQFYYFLLVCSIGCSLKTADTYDSLKIIDVKSHLQLYEKNEKKLFDFGNTSRIAFQGNDRLYIFTRIKTYRKMGWDDKGLPIEKSIRTDTTYDIFAIEKGKQMGLRYSIDNFQNEKGSVFQIDSVLEHIGLGKDNHKSFNFKLGIPSSVEKDGRNTIERFSFNKTTPEDPDSVYRFFDKDLSKIDFTFSAELDKESDSKLYKTIFIFKPIRKGTASPNVEIPRRFIENSIAISNFGHEKRLKEIFEKFKRDRQKSK